MGANAATQALQVVDNVERVLAIELYNAAQALDFRLPKKTSPFLNAFIQSYRNEVSFVKEDKFMHEDIMKSIDFLQSLKIDNEIIFNSL